MEITAIIVIAAIFVAIFYFGSKLKKSIRTEDRMMSALDDLGIPKHKANFKFDYVTPRGIKVKSTATVPEKALTLIDSGIENQIVRHSARYPSWALGKEHVEYSVLFIEPMATNVETEPGSPALLVKGIQTAGTCIGERPASMPLVHIVLPNQGDTDWRYEDYLMFSAWYESEHIRESMNDWDVFYEFVGAGDVHPHVP